MCELCERIKKQRAERELVGEPTIDLDNLPPFTIDETFDISEGFEGIRREVNSHIGDIKTVRQFAAVVLTRRVAELMGDQWMLFNCEVVLRLYAADFFFDHLSRTRSVADHEKGTIRVLITRPSMKEVKPV